MLSETSFKSPVKASAPEYVRLHLFVDAIKYRLHEQRKKHKHAHTPVKGNHACNNS